MWHALAAPTRVPQFPELVDPPTSPVDYEDDEPLSPTTSPNGLRRSTLTEALRSNPFRPTSRDGPPSSARSISQKRQNVEDAVDSLNSDLRILANVHPDVKIEVLRELLIRFDDGDSRLHVCTEELFRHKNEWAKGRLINPSRDLDEIIPVEDLFRKYDYISVCERTLSAEFKSLNKSVVDAVLAEVNNSYTRARPILQGLAAKTWRATLSSLFKRKKTQDELPSFLYTKAAKNERSLCSTGNKELDQELDRGFAEPSRKVKRQAQQTSDQELATTLNQQEAERTGSLFECQCCYDDVPFEQIAACTTELHTVCHNCVRRSLSEALFGQSWMTSIDMSMGTLRCVASSADTCSGIIPADLVHNAVVSTKAGSETWSKFDQRLANETLTKSNLQLVSCPFCNYAEASHVRSMDTASKIQWRFNFRLPHLSIPSIFLVCLLELLLPSILLTLLILHYSSPTTIRQYLHTSLLRLSTRNQTKIFQCRHPSCLHRSCRACHKQWHDPHTCHEPLILSLRTTVEAARTAALKRTCPRCGTSFVKSSGCNKLTCLCGYAMCYLCRKNIGKVVSSPVAAAARQNRAGGGQMGGLGAGAGVEDDAMAAAGEGYRHFCEHFRPVQGMKCTECDKCDLYKTEDEDAVVRRAGEEAERVWRLQHVKELGGGANGVGGSDGTVALGSADIKGLDEAVRGYNGHEYAGGRSLQGGIYGVWYGIWGRQWSLQGLVDEVVGRCITIIDDV